jgi:O-antigen/teichoic acid export membrane protein
MSTNVESDELARFEISKKLLFVNTASSLVAMGLNVTVLVWLQRFLLSRISTEEYSLLPVLYSIMMFAPLLTQVLSGGLWRYTTEAYAEGNAFRVTQIVSTMFPILVVAGFLVFMIGLGVARYVDVILTISPKDRSQAQIMLALLMLALGVRMILAPFLYGLQMKQQFVLANAVETGGQFLRIAILFVLLFAVSVKVLWVVVATVIAEFITEIVKIVLSRRAVPSLRIRRNAFDWSIARQIISFNGWSTITALSMTITTSADAIILNKLGTPLDVTCFYLGALPIRFINMIGSAAERPLRPVLVGMHATGQTDRLRSVFLRGGRWTLWVTMFVAVPLMVFGREIITLYVGSEYRLAGIVMVLVLLIVPIGYGTKMLFPIAEATGDIRRLSIYCLAMGMLNLALTLYLVGKLEMGAIGSGLGSAISFLIFYPVLFWPLAVRIAHVRFGVWIRETMWPGLLPAMASGMVLWCLKQVVEIDNWVNLIGCVVVGVVTYAIVLWFGALEKADRAVVFKALQEVRGRFGFGFIFGAAGRR